MSPNIEKLRELVFFGLPSYLVEALRKEDNIISSSFPTLEIKIEEDNAKLKEVSGLLKHQEDIVLYLAGSPDNYPLIDENKSIPVEANLHVIIEATTDYLKSKGIDPSDFKDIHKQAHNEVAVLTDSTKKYYSHSLWDNRRFRSAYLAQLDIEKELWAKAIEKITGISLSEDYITWDKAANIRATCLPREMSEVHDQYTVRTDLKLIKNYLEVVYFIGVCRKIKNLPSPGPSGTIFINSAMALEKHFPSLDENAQKSVLFYLYDITGHKFEANKLADGRYELNEK